MNIDQIKYFLEVDKYKSFSVAADELCISQSSLSKQIKSLESMLGVVLFKRNTRNISLTLAGEEFKKSANKILKEYYLMTSNLKKYSKSNIQTIDVATIPVITQYKITTLIAEFQTKYPNIKINIKESEYEDIMSLYDRSEINLSFIRTDHLDNTNLITIPLIDDELVLVTSNTHPLSSKKYVSLSDLSQENFVLLGSESGVYKSCMKSFEKAGFSPKINYSNSRLETIIGLVSDNLGVTLLMNKVISYFNNPNISTILLKENIKSTLALAYSNCSQLTKNEQLFIDFIISKTTKLN